MQLNANVYYMNQIQTPHAQTVVGLLPEHAGITSPDHFSPAVDREFEGIAADYNKPAGTTYGTARELSPAEQALIKPAEAVGKIAIGIYSVGPVQSEAAQARIAEHEKWMNSGERAAAQAEVLAMQAAVDAEQRKSFRPPSETDDDEEDD